MVRRRTAARLRRTALYVLVTGTCLVVIFPFYWMLTTSLKPTGQTYVYPPTLFPRRPIWSNYREVFAKYQVGMHLLTTLKVAGSVAVISVFSAILGGYALSRLRVRGRRVMLQLLFVSQMLPATLLLIPLYEMLQGVGMLNTLQALILVNCGFTTPVAMLMLKGFFDTIPVDIEEAGLIDGCTRLGVLRYVVLPLSIPGLITVALVVLNIAWNEYLYAVTLTFEPSKQVISVRLALLLGAYATPWNYVMAVAVLGTLPSLMVFMFLQRWFMSGAIAGALKG